MGFCRSTLGSASRLDSSSRVLTVLNKRQVSGDAVSTANGDNEVGS